MQISTSQILAEQLSQNTKPGTFIIAVSGFGGSGKTTFAHELATLLVDSKVIGADDFIIDRLSARSEDWDGVDWMRLVNQILEPASMDNKNLSWEPYDWATNSLKPTQTITTPKYLIIEGIGLIRPELKKFFDTTVWLDVPLEDAIKRGSARDAGWGLDHDKPWKNLWGPNDKDYFEKYKPRKSADYVVNFSPIPVLYIMCGLGFSGKSTLAKQIAQHFKIPIVSTDEMFWELKLKSGDYEGWSELLRLSKERTTGFLKNGQSVIYDYTSEKREQRDELRTLAGKAGASATVVYLATQDEEIFQRQQRNKETKERHDPKQEDLDAVKRNFEVPSPEEGNVTIFKPGTDIDSFLASL